MQKITPNLWCNGNAEEMVEFYGHAFSEFEVLQTEYYPQTKEDGLEDFQVELLAEVSALLLLPMIRFPSATVSGCLACIP